MYFFNNLYNMDIFIALATSWCYTDANKANLNVLSSTVSNYSVITIIINARYLCGNWCTFL